MGAGWLNGRPAGLQSRERLDVIGRDAGDDACTIHKRALAKPVVGAVTAAPPNVKLWGQLGDGLRMPPQCRRRPRASVASLLIFLAGHLARDQAVSFPHYRR